MVRRKQLERLEWQLGAHSAVVLVGPRQVGKTTLALEIAAGRPSVYLDLELPSDLAKIRDMEAFCALHPDSLIILDEIQRVPELFEVLRGIIDQRRRAGQQYGQFLLLGSASLELLQKSSETLAGRMALCELSGLAPDEVSPDDTLGLWVRGGFPDSFLAPSDAHSLDWRLEFIRTYLERDIPALGPRIPAETMRRLWTMLAHLQGQIHNAARLAAGVGISGVTIARYVDLLVDLLLIRRLPAWASTGSKRLIKSPKLYLRDSGICHALLGIESAHELFGHPVLGGSWESFVIESIAGELPRRSQMFFYRTSGGAELDLLLEHADGSRWAIEIKHSRAPVLSRGFYEACNDVAAARRFVVHSGTDAFPMRDGIMALPLLSMLDELRSFGAAR